MTKTQESSSGYTSFGNDEVRYREFIEYMKAEPVDTGLIRNIPIETIIAIMSSWPHVDAKFDGDLNGEIETKGYPQRYEDVWGHVSYNPDKLVGLVGAPVGSDAVMKIALSGAIYPDGTVNVDWLNTSKEWLLKSELQRR